MQSRLQTKKIPTNGGQVMIALVMLLLAGSLVVVGSVSPPVLRDVQIVRTLEESKQSFALSEGVAEDLTYRIKKGDNYSLTENLSLSGVTATATVDVLLDGVEVTTVGDKNSVMRTTKVTLSQGVGVAFSYGIQSGEGGIHMKNLSSVAGNIYANGPVVGEHSNRVYGDVISAGAVGIVDGVHATSSIFAHTIIDSEVDRDAYYQEITNTIIGGIAYPGSADQATSTLPISDALIGEWEAAAEVGGIITSPCPYTIDSDVSIGPIKIECDLEIENSPTVTLDGVVWVTGDIDIKNSATIQVSPTRGGASIAMIADDPLNRTTSSKIEAENNSTFLGSGTEGSYVLLVSQNNSAENGGDETAIEMENNASGDLLLYAGHGEIVLQNNINLIEVTGYKISLQNNARVMYETGVANLLFTSGPSGGYVLNSWSEI